MEESVRNLIAEVGRLREIAEITLRLRREGELPKTEALRLLQLMREELTVLAGSRELRVVALIEGLMNLIERLPIQKVPALERLIDKLPPLPGILFPRPREVINEIGFMVERIMERLMERSLILDEHLRLSIAFDPIASVSGVDKAHLGYLAEVVGRCWLRDVLGGAWRNAEYRILNSKDVDALSLTSEQGVLVAYMSEIKLRAEKLEKDIENVAETVKEVDKYCMDQRKYGLGKRHEIKEIALVCFNSAHDEMRNSIINGLMNWLPASFKEKRIVNIKVYDLNDILNYCQKVVPGANIAKSVAILSKLIGQN